MTETYKTAKGICSQVSCLPNQTGCNVEGEFDPCDCKYFNKDKSIKQ